MATTTSFKFVEVFPNINDFQEYCEELDLTNSCEKNDTNTFVNFVYKILLWKYGTVDIAYNTKVEFLMELGLILEDTFNQYQTEVRLINNIYWLNDNEFTKISKEIISIAQQNNVKLDDPAKWLGFVSHQNYRASDVSKFQAYVTAIKQIPSYQKRTYANKFSSLFQTFFTDQFYISKGGENDY